MRYFILIILFCQIQLSAQEQCPAFNDKGFENGESLEYRVGYYFLGVWVKAGRVNFTIKDSVIGEKTYDHFLARANTFPSYDWMYKVRDRYESLVDQQSHKPYMFQRKVLEDDTSYYNKVYFDYEEMTARSEVKTIAIDSCAYDVVTAVYYSRGLDWENAEEGDTLPLNLYLEDSIYNVYVRFLGREEIKTAVGKFKTVLFSPLLIEGTLFKAGEGMVVWVTDDQYKIPLRVSTPILVGSVRAEIHSWEGISEEVPSKIEGN